MLKRIIIVYSIIIFMFALNQVSAYPSDLIENFNGTWVSVGVPPWGLADNGKTWLVVQDTSSPTFSVFDIAASIPNFGRFMMETDAGQPLVQGNATLELNSSQIIKTSRSNITFLLNFGGTSSNTGTQAINFYSNTSTTNLERINRIVIDTIDNQNDLKFNNTAGAVFSTSAGRQMVSFTVSFYFSKDGGNGTMVIRQNQTGTFKDAVASFSFNATNVTHIGVEHLADADANTLSQNLGSINVSNAQITSVDITKPIVKSSFNLTSYHFNTQVNYSSNLSDETALLRANITINYSSGKQKINFTISGTSARIYNVTILQGIKGDVINFTTFVEDSSNNKAQNSTLITLADYPQDLEFINNSNPSQGEKINVSANVSDFAFLSKCSFFENQSLTGGAYTIFNYTLSGISDQCSQNYTIRPPAGNLINFSVVITDELGFVSTNTTLITVAASASSESKQAIDILRRGGTIGGKQLIRKQGT